MQSLDANEANEPKYFVVFKSHHQDFIFEKTLKKIPDIANEELRR
jgi:hypothetical protein